MNRDPRFPARMLLLVLVGSLLAGCGGGDNSVTPLPPPPPPLTSNDTPATVMQRFDEAYSGQQAGPFAALLTSDFHFTFSADTDPTLVAQYGTNWGKNDESLSALHLFEGFTSSTSGNHIPGATTITMALNSVQVLDDPAHADSVGYYKWVTVARVVMAIEIPGSPDPVSYNIDARHDFYLVRGDAAVLDSNQDPRSDRWYIRRWDDLSTYLAGPTPSVTSTGDPPTPSKAETWGRVKAQYR